MFFRTSNNTGIPFEPQSKRHSELQEIDQEVELGGHLIPKGAEILAWCSWLQLFFSTHLVLLLA